MKKNGIVVYLVDGWAVDNPNEPQVAKFGILQSDLVRRNDRGQISALAQFDGIIGPGLIFARHIFVGLNRPLYADDSMEADKYKLVHTWRPKFDFDWPDPYGRPRRLLPETNRVFVVIMTKNVRHNGEWPEVYGWIDRWNWVDEDPGLKEAPINHFSRYGKRLFTRKGV